MTQEQKKEFSHIEHMSEKLNIIDNNVIKVAELKMQFGGDSPTWPEELNLREAVAEHEAFLLDQLSTAATPQALDLAKFELQHFKLMTNGSHNDVGRVQIP